MKFILHIMTFLMLFCTTSIQTNPLTASNAGWHENYHPIKEFVLDSEFEDKTSFVFIEGNEYIIGSNDHSIYITLLEQHDMKLKHIAGNRTILLQCRRSNVYHIHSKITDYDSSKTYKVIIYYKISE